MAKKHLLMVIRAIEEQYASAQDLYEQFAMDTKDLVIMDDTMQSLTDKKILLDNELILYSVSASAAVAAVTQKYLDNEERIMSSFDAPLESLLSNLSDNPSDEQSANLLISFNDKIRKSRHRSEVLLMMKFYRNLPNRKKKARAFEREMTIKERIEKEVSRPLREMIDQLSIAYKEFLSTPVIPTDKGDLDE